MEEYIIHNNGGRPFKVTVSPNNTIGIYEINPNDDDYLPTNLAGFGQNPIAVFVGEDDDVNSPLTADDYFETGNTILLEFPNNAYVFISDKIYYFTTESRIIEYHTPIGNNDVPYPYAIDENNDIYLMIEDVIVRNPTNDANIENDPYSTYYGIKGIRGIVTVDPFTMQVLYESDQ